MGLVGSQLCLFFPFAVLVAITWSYVIADEGGWGEAHATFYGGSDASGTNNGACGYGNQISSYGVATTALSTPLFNGGDICGACFAIKCFNDVGCLPGEPLLVVTATNLCPLGSNGGWCDPPKHHFDLSQPAFSQIARLGYGHVPLAYKRVPCKRWGGIQFNINGHTFFNLVLITNVGGAGDIRAVAIKGEGGEWMQMNRNWGQNWQIGGDLGARMLSFQLTSSDGRTLTCYNVAPSNWQFGKTYVGGQF